VRQHSAEHIDRQIAKTQKDSVMGNLAGLKHIVHAALMRAFADLACLDSRSSNEIMQRYPRYREAKDLVDDGFWLEGGGKMLTEVRAALKQAEERAEVDLDECA
jgi:hypothetical protein